MVNLMREEARRERQQTVLEMIVRYHTGTAQPVGSSLISREVGLSSATIRNIMFELEEMGLIRQPHTSAGRVPTEKGYRAYVDLLMESAGALKKPCDGSGEETMPITSRGCVEDIIMKGLQLCSRLTSQACMALFPNLKIRDHIIGKLESSVKEMLLSLYDFEDRLYLDGAHYLIEQPEFRDAGKIGSVLRILEDKKGLMYILEEDLKFGGVKVHIGSENKTLGFDECTLITANYGFEGDIMGTLGIIGPIRMEYERIIPTVGGVAEAISRIFDEMSQEEADDEEREQEG